MARRNLGKVASGSIRVHHSRSPWHGNPITYHIDGALDLIDGGDDLLKAWQSHCLKERADKETGGQVSRV